MQRNCRIRCNKGCEFSSSARRVRQQIKMSAESRERKRNKERELAGPKREGGRARRARGNEVGRMKADRGID